MKYQNYILIVSFIITPFLKTYAQDNKFTGYATSLVNQDSIISINCFGFSDKEKLVKYTSSTIQPIGSVSKTFIGISIMIAKDKGLIDLDEDINKYLDFKLINPYFKKENVITLRHLATHTSGIIDSQKTYESSYSEGLRPILGLGDFLKQYLINNGEKYSKKNFKKSEAGSKYEYSNIASGLAAYIIERVSGKPFNLFVEENILNPLKMENSGYFYQDIDISNHAILYDTEDNPIQPYSCAVYPDGSLKTTIIDLSIYLKELIKGYNQNSKLLLSKTSWKELFNKNFTKDFTIKNINPKEPNSGIFIIYFKSGKIGHTGSDLGASTIMIFNPKDSTGKIFMSNEDLIEKNVDTFKLIWNNIN